MRIEPSEAGYSLFRSGQTESGKPFDYKVLEIPRLTAPSAVPTNNLTPDELAEIRPLLQQCYVNDVRQLLARFTEEIVAKLGFIDEFVMDAATAASLEKALADALRRSRKAKKKNATVGLVRARRGDQTSTSSLG